MTFRLLGLPDELRLDIEQSSGLTTEGVKLIIETSVNEANALFETATKEIQEVVGPHGSVTRLQAGGVKISQGLGISVYADGVKKTTIDPEGNVFVGSNVEDPANTTFCVFVNDQLYNNEQMGAGDLLFGDNSADTSNVKFDASEGQLQFRYGSTVNVYMDTDGSLKAGGGIVTLDSSGITLTRQSASTDAARIKWKTGSDNTGTIESYGDGAISTMQIISGLGTYPSIIGALALSAGGSGASQITLSAITNGITQAYLLLNDNGIIISAGNDGGTSAEVAINEYGHDQNTRIEGDTDANLLFVDAGTDRVGIGDGAPGEKLDVAGNINVTGVYKIGDAQLDAGDIPITDSGGYYTGTDVEAALQEIAGGGGTSYDTLIEGARLVYNSATSVSVGIGKLYAENGDEISITSTLTASSLSLSASTFYHIYVYLSGGTPTLEVVTTAPVAWKGSAYSKTSDTSRRYVGSIYADASGNVTPFVHVEGFNQILYHSINTIAAPYRILNGGTATTATVVDPSSIVPITAYQANCILTNYITAGSAVLRVNLTNTISASSLMIVLSANTYYRADVPLDSSRQFYYAYSVAPTGGAYIDMAGYTFRR